MAFTVSDKVRCSRVAYLALGNKSRGQYTRVGAARFLFSDAKLAAGCCRRV